MGGFDIDGGGDFAGAEDFAVAQGDLAADVEEVSDSHGGDVGADGFGGWGESEAELGEFGGEVHWRNLTSRGIKWQGIL